MGVVVVKYNAGNVRSVLCALGRLGCEAEVSDDPEVLRRADRVIFPGVGEAATAMAYLRSHGLDAVLKGLRRPFLGICLGMQLMCASSEEGGAQCLGMFDVAVRAFPTGRGDKIPHVGWNTMAMRRNEALFQGLGDEVWCYFVHGYYVPACTWSVGLTSYDGVSFSSALHRDNFWGCQFHPEKSSDAGGRMLRNFLENC